jgi:hypothetical protein
MTEKTWRVRYGGWIIHEGKDYEKAYDAYLGCGPYGTIERIKEVE